MKVSELEIGKEYRVVAGPRKGEIVKLFDLPMRDGWDGWLSIDPVSWFGPVELCRPEWLDVLEDAEV